MIEIKIPFKTPTVNHLYFNWKNRRILTKEARKLKDEIAAIVMKQKPECFECDQKTQLEVNVLILEDWYTKKGLIARKDIANREKFLIDTVFKALGIDDRLIFKHTMLKVQSNKELAIIRIEKVRYSKATL